MSEILFFLSLMKIKAIQGKKLSAVILFEKRRLYEFVKLKFKAPARGLCLPF